MAAVLEQALAAQLLAMADDELILAHRNSEWTGHAPILEEDIAFSNIAVDELGHATLWYGLHGDLTGEDADKLVFFRSAPEFRNTQLVELPKNDWAFTIVRQFLFDAAERARLALLSESAYAPMAEAAAKMYTEELYHFRHTHAWLQRLGLGTDESHRRMQRALDQLWPYIAQLFTPLPQERLLVAADYTPDPPAVRAAWEALVHPALQEADLTAPGGAAHIAAGRDKHTPHLEALLAEMQSVARLDPQAVW